MSIEIVQSDITTLRVDAIVNAANEALLDGGGRAALLARQAPKAGCRMLGCLPSQGWRG